MFRTLIPFQLKLREAHPLRALRLSPGHANGSRSRRPRNSSADDFKEKLTEALSHDIVNRRLTMTTKTFSEAQACESEPAVCCPPEGQAGELLTAQVEGPAADDELAAFAKAIAHPTR
ncbi:MAG: hypothetical protein ABJA98_16245, partial [Acidobacteriota bacterium]